MQFSFLQTLTIILFLILLVVWVIAIPNPKEHAWANNPWLPTMVIALLWGVWIERAIRH